MIAQVMVQPSALMPSGTCMIPFGDVFVFRFTEELQIRLEFLLEQNKLDILSSEQKAELDGITELSRIFTLINAQIVAKAKWCPIKPENLFDNEQITSANTVTHQSI